MIKVLCLNSSIKIFPRGICTTFPSVKTKFLPEGKWTNESDPLSRKNDLESFSGSNFIHSVVFSIIFDHSFRGFSPSISSFLITTKLNNFSRALAPLPRLTKIDLTMQSVVFSEDLAFLMSSLSESRINESFCSSSDKTTLGGISRVFSMECCFAANGSLTLAISFRSSAGIVVVVSVLISPLSRKSNDNSCSRTIHDPCFNCKDSFSFPLSLNNSKAWPLISSVCTNVKHSSGKTISLNQLHSSSIFHSFNGFERCLVSGLFALKASKCGSRPFIRIAWGPILRPKTDMIWLSSPLASNSRALPLTDFSSQVIAYFLSSPIWQSHSAVLVTSQVSILCVADKHKTKDQQENWF